MNHLITWELSHSSGFRVTGLNYGAIIQGIYLDDHRPSCVLGFDDPKEYMRGNPSYLGAVIGRVANRIAKGKFSLGDTCYELDKNEQGIQTLHGGKQGLHQAFFTIREKSTTHIVLSYQSVAGENGFPGNVDIRVTYRLIAPYTLQVSYEAHADILTPIDLTQHSYFNLSNDSTIAQHRLHSKAAHYLPIDANNIPTGEILPTVNTAFDLHTEIVLEKIMGMRGGFDEYFIVPGTGLRKMATISAENTCLQVLSTTPGFQCYTGKYLPAAYSGICIETQGFPNAINTPEFPSIWITPEKPYFAETQFIFDK